MEHLGKPTFLLSLAFIVALGAGISERVLLLDAYEEVAFAREGIRRLSHHKKALLSTLNDVELGSPFLTAEVVAGSSLDGLVLQDPSDILLYLLSTDCPHCSKNYHFLNDLAESGVPVIGLATDTIVDVIATHQSEHDVRFPILFDPRGSAMDLLPGYATPTLVVVANREVVFVEFGELQTEDQERLRALTAGWEVGWMLTQFPYAVPTVGNREEGKQDC